MEAGSLQAGVTRLGPRSARYSPDMSPAMARFEVVAGRAIGMSILIDDELLIGRHADGAGRLADDEEISRSHARISLDRSGFCAIEDLGSTNGTFVNGLRITGPQTLSVGDTIELGGTTLVVRELPIPATERSLKAVHPQPTVVPRGAPAPSQETPGHRGRPLRQAPARTARTRAPSRRSAHAAAHLDAGRRRCQRGQTTGEPLAHPARGLRPRARRPSRSTTARTPIRLVFDGTAWRPAAS